MSHVAPALEEPADEYLEVGGTLHVMQELVKVVED